MRVGSLFSGIGGLDLGLERAGMEVIWQVENDPWCQTILEKHWPDVKRYGDVKEQHELEEVDLICGGFPCQPVSLAGRRQAQSDSRWLWPEFFRIVRLLRPRYVLVENVPGLASAGMGDVLGDLASDGFDAEWESISAAAVGAPHLRYRIFIVAYTSGAGRRQDARSASSDEGADEGRTAQDDYQLDGDGESGRAQAVADTDPGRRDGRTRIFGQGWRSQPADGDWWTTEPDVGRVAHGIPRRVDRLRGLGNAVVPQVAQWVGEQIMGFDERR